MCSRVNIAWFILKIIIVLASLQFLKCEIARFKSDARECNLEFSCLAQNDVSFARATFIETSVCRVVAGAKREGKERREREVASGGRIKNEEKEEGATGPYTESD